MSLMDDLRRMFGMHDAPPMSDEQARVAERLKRIELRQRAIDVQVDVLRADRRDVKQR